MSLILNEDGTIYSDSSLRDEYIKNIVERFNVRHNNLFNWIRGREVIDGKIQNDRREENHSCSIVPQEAKTGGSDISPLRRKAESGTTKALPMGAAVGSCRCIDG
jgi:hypothetical protein